MRNFVYSGIVVNIKAPKQLKSGELILLGSMPVVANTDAELGDLVAVTTQGVFKYLIAGKYALGDMLYYRKAGDAVTINKVAAGGTAIGIALTEGENSLGEIIIGTFIPGPQGERGVPGPKGDKA